MLWAPDAIRLSTFNPHVVTKEESQISRTDFHMKQQQQQQQPLLNSFANSLLSGTLIVWESDQFDGKKQGNWSHGVADDMLI
ncbi:hypothetical protein SUNI508_12667 [Seiridium unicorne]|uniref:Uncharacterized protein n=1 Tax=Seiridium unicorne TaxID=138068 RepID=A0ABR2VHF3_9PEZI